MAFALNRTFLVVISFIASKTALSGLQQARLSQQATPTNSANPPITEQTEWQKPE
jgi:hypothetical protein